MWLHGYFVKHVDPKFDGNIGEIINIHENYSCLLLEVLWKEPIDGEFVTIELPVDLKILESANK